METGSRIAVILLVVAGGVAVGVLKGRKTPEEKLAAGARIANEQCPMMIDADTRLEKVTTGPGMRIEYWYTAVTTDKDEVDPTALQASLRTFLLEMVKTAEEMRSLRELQVIFVYTYADKNGRPLASIEISPADYGGGWAGRSARSEE